MLDTICRQSEEKMRKSIEALKKDLTTMRTGHASTDVLQGIKVDYYDTLTPLTHLATVSAPQPTCIVIQPWDKSVAPAIEKAILSSDLGLTPQISEGIIRITLPPLTQERREELLRLIKKRVEEGKVSVREARRQANETLKAGEKDKKLPEDDYYKGVKKVQELTDKYIKEIDQVFKDKEKEITEF
jgi:ribosome recycling factor